MPANKEVAVSWGFSCVKEMADATGVDYSNIKTEEDLVPLLEAVKEMYPDVWPVVSGGGAMTVLNTSDDLGGDIGSLLDCTNPDDTTVINWYASDEYKEIVERRYEWVKKGLIPPDASSFLRIRLPLRSQPVEALASSATPSPASKWSTSALPRRKCWSLP